MFITKNIKTSKIGTSSKKSIFENFVIIKQELEKQIVSNLTKLNYIEKLHNYIDQLKDKNHKQSEDIRVTRKMLNDYICQNRQLKDKIRKIECENECLKNLRNLNKKDEFSYNKYL